MKNSESHNYITVEPTEELRSIVRDLAELRSHLLAVVLLEVVARTEMWRHWGYKTFAEYLDQDLHLPSVTGFDAIAFAISLGYDHASNYRSPASVAIRWIKDVFTDGSSIQTMSDEEALHQYELIEKNARPEQMREMLHLLRLFPATA